jgi:hypothetical protein
MVSPWRRPLLSVVLVSRVESKSNRSVLPSTHKIPPPRRSTSSRNLRSTPKRRVSSIVSLRTQISLVMSSSADVVRLSMALEIVQHLEKSVANVEY